MKARQKRKSLDKGYHNILAYLGIVLEDVLAMVDEFRREKPEGEWRGYSTQLCNKKLPGS